MGIFFQILGFWLLKFQKIADFAFKWSLSVGDMTNKHKHKQKIHSLNGP